MIMEREYNLSRSDVLNLYTWEEVQDRVSALPAERIYPRHEGMTNAEYKNSYLEALCDRIMSDEAQAEKEYIAFNARMDRIKGAHNGNDTR